MLRTQDVALACPADAEADESWRAPEDHIAPKYECRKSRDRADKGGCSMSDRGWRIAAVVGLLILIGLGLLVMAQNSAPSPACRTSCVGPGGFRL